MQSCSAPQGLCCASSHMHVCKVQQHDESDKAYLEGCPRFGNQVQCWHYVVHDDSRQRLSHECKAEHMWEVLPQQGGESQQDERVVLQAQMCKGHDRH